MEASIVNDVKTDPQEEEEPGNVITMVDVLEEQKVLEEDANAVLGGSDDKNCTYNKGYVSRQALYVCATCTPSTGTTTAGICLACSYHCHEGHELTELYTKRNFRCDCGNSHFPNNKCNLDPIKESVNELNQYNQNFKGVYCTCKRPYPDPEDGVQDEMIQCIICEDWYHGRHLQSEIPVGHNYSEMICFLCMKEFPFLWKYSDLAIKKNESSAEEISIVDEDCDKTNPNISQNLDVSVASEQDDGSKCHIDGKSLEVGTGSLFWPEGWRKKLCHCDSCLKMYSDLNIKFLLEECDTVQHYEEVNKVEESQYEQGMKALSTLGRVQQVEAIQEYNSMKTALKEYLQKFVENKKVVREEDIHEFFTQMQAKKKQKVEMPYFCR